MSMTNDRSKATASVSHFTHNGRRTGDPLSPRWTSALPPDLLLPACLLASSPPLSSALTSCLYWKQSGRKRSSWQRAAGGEKEEEEKEVEVENYFCAPLAAVHREDALIFMR